MIHFFKNILKRLLLILAILIIFCGIKQSPCAEASVSLKAGISYEPATGNLDAASLPSGISSFYSHESPYFILAGGSDVYFKKVTLYIYNSSGSQVFSHTETPINNYFRYANISVQLSSGSYKYEWEYLVTTGSSSNSYQTIKSGKFSFSVTDLTYMVSYNANGGNGVPSSQTKYYGEPLTLSLTTPTRTGYIFLGWSTSSTASVANSSYAPGSSYSTNSNLNLYAVWEINKYSVTYNANGGSGAPSSQTKYYGEPLSLRTTKPTRVGYTFLGWSTNSSATIATYQPGGEYTHNIGATLYAVWRPYEYNVYYNANGGSGAPSSQIKYYGQPLTLSNVKPTRDGYTFIGWSMSSTATSAGYQAGGSYIYNSEVTLYAVWKFDESKSTVPTQAPTASPDNKGNYSGSSGNNSSAVQTPKTTIASNAAANTKSGASTSAKKNPAVKTGRIYKKGNIKYKITKITGKSGNVTVMSGTNKKVKKLVIPQSIKLNGITLKITAIGKNAFKNYGKLSFLRIKSKTITKIGKNALKGTKKKIKIMVPTSKLKSYSKMLRKAR